MEKGIWQRFRDRGVVVLGINTAERQDSEQMARQFVRQHGVTYPTLLDLEEEATQAYQVQGLPTNGIVDRGGVLRFLQAGFNENLILERIESLLAAN